MVLSASLCDPGDEALRDLLQDVKTVAVVGYSPKVSRPSHSIAAGLQRRGFRVIPVRPGIREGLGETAYPDLLSVPGPVDLVDVFRDGQYVPGIVDQCLARGFKKLWLQEGCVNEAAAERACAAGMQVVMDRCVLRDYVRLFT